MSKAQYFEMCEMMGTEPIDSEVPVELDDLPNEVQIALDIYHNLHDKWDSMVGMYLGKDLSIIREVFELWEIPKHEQKTYFILIRLIDSIRAEEIRKNSPKS